MTTTPTDDFVARAESHRPALRAHCYRMTASLEDAEDLVQETLLRAWRRQDSLHERSLLRPWLYRIATNVCLDALRRQPDRVAIGKGVEVPWLQPFPDEFLDQIAAGEEAPDATVAAKETIELAFLVAIQHLPPRQRAVLLMRDVLGWSAAQAAETLEQSVPAVNSALQRAHATLREQLPQRRSQWTAGEPSSEERELLERYMQAHHNADPDAIAALVGDEMRFTMPPQPTLIEGPQAFVRFMTESAFGADSPGEFRLVPARANRQPAAANYIRAPGQDAFVAMSLDVLRIEGGRLVEVTTFEPHLFAAFGLPAQL